MFESKKNSKTIQSAKIKVSAKREKRERFNHVWWLPLITLMLVSYIAVTHFTTRGTLVTISFKSAEGLEVSKTKVRYKDVIVGKVESITLNKDLEGVKVGLRMNKDSEELLRKATRFWVVKPTLSITQVTGLGTLIAGYHITLDPDKTYKSQYSYEFKGLEVAPVLTQEQTGLNITLLSSRASSFKQGTAVYYKGYAVGRVNSVKLTDDYKWVRADVSIQSPHDKLIKPNTRFWSSSGISISANSDGLDIEMESIETLIAGGITFGTPVTAYDFGPVKNKQEFRVFDSEEHANEEIIGKTYSFVTYFDGSIQGLDEGSPVTIQGMKVGKVTSIRLIFDDNLSKPLIPVVLEVYEENFNRVGRIDKSFSTKEASADDENGQNNTQKADEKNPIVDTQKLMAQLLKRGLHTQLTTSSLITGKKHIALIFGDDKQNQDIAIKTDPITQQTVLPSTIESFDAITSGIGKMVDKVNALPIEDIVSNVNSLVSNANRKVEGLEIDRTIAGINTLIENIDKKINKLALNKTVDNLNGFIKDGRKLSSTAKTTLKSLDKSIAKVSKSANSTLAGYSSDAPLYYNLNTSLNQLNETMSSLKTVMDMLERHPNSLVFGEDRPQEPQEFYWDKEKK